MPKDDPLQITVEEGRNPGTRILRLTGPVTLANLFALQDALRGGEQPPVTILELCGVLYMDSAGMGAVINYFTYCERNGKKLLVAGVSSRVGELFRMTKVDTVIPMVETVEEAEGRI